MALRGRRGTDPRPGERDDFDPDAGAVVTASATGRNRTTVIPAKACIQYVDW